MFCLSVPGAKRPRIFIFLGRFAPFFWWSGCSELGHGFLIRNTLQVFKKLKRSCKYELATATKVRISRKYDETSANWSYFTQYYEKNWKKKTFVHGFSYKTHYERYLLNDSQSPRLICSNSMLAAINSTKISTNLRESWSI